MKLRNLGTWAVLFGLSLPVWAGDRSGVISGYVRNADGNAQMGAVVQILGAANRTFIVFTDGAGHYAATGLLPGFYTLKVSAPSFLPTLRERIGLGSGASVSVNVTLNTLLSAMQLGTPRVAADDDDWKWTLRSVANRPILRVFDDPPVRIFHDETLPAEDQEQEIHEISGTVSFVAGSAAGGYGSGSDMTTGFTLERSIFADGHLSFHGDVGYDSAENVPGGVLRASYTNKLPDGSEPSMAMTVRRFMPSDPNLHNAALQSLALSAGDDFTLNDVVEFKFGSELQSIQFLNHVTALRPYGTADVHLSPNTVLEYQYATSRPDSWADKGFDSAPADMSDSNPRVSLLNFAPKVERAHHQELSLSRRVGKKNNVQVAVFSDRVVDPALTGTGAVTAAGGFLLPDVPSGTFSFAGENLNTNGARLVLQRHFLADLTATIDYAFGGVLNLTQPGVQLQGAQQSISTLRRHAAAAKLSGTLPGSHTRFITSYRWIDAPAVTPVDMFNASPGQSDPFLNIFIRQPIPFLPGHVEAIIDIRNLLAQGYIPVLAQDGQTVYLVQAARSVRGGLTFTF